MKRLVLWIILFLSISISMLTGRMPSVNETYQIAVDYEKRGEYERAESLYVDLYQRVPDNYTYYSRYRGLLIRQRKFEQLLPVIEERISKRPYDTYLKLESGVLYFALNDIARSRGIWKETIGRASGSMARSYANSVYQYAVEYGQGIRFYLIVQDLRTLTSDPSLLANYNFPLLLRYQNWDEAVNEIIHILKNNPTDLKYVRAYLFRYDPGSALYPQAIRALADNKTSQGKILLADIDVHVGLYQDAFDVLRQNPDIPAMVDAMKEFASKMFQIPDFNMAIRAARWTESHAVKKESKYEMALLAARSREGLFWEQNNEPELITSPFLSDFTRIRFKPFGEQSARLISSAYDTYDSLKQMPGPNAQLASLRHAEISYLVYQDFDRALEEYLQLSHTISSSYRREVLSRIADLLLAKGEVEQAVKFMASVSSEYHLMVHEEDQLLPQFLFVSLISGETDSLMKRVSAVLTMLPKTDPKYNDVLAMAEFTDLAARDSLHVSEWLEAERYLLQNKIASAVKLYGTLLKSDSPALTVYGVRYLECLRVLNDPSAEAVFWEANYDRLLQTDMGDYFMIRYAEFLQKMNKNDISIEILEKYLLSYRESMYYEQIREYVRQHDSQGAP